MLVTELSGGRSASFIICINLHTTTTNTVMLASLVEDLRQPGYSSASSGGFINCVHTGLGILTSVAKQGDESIIEHGTQVLEGPSRQGSLYLMSIAWSLSLTMVLVFLVGSINGFIP